MERSARQAREGFSDMVNRAAYSHERVVVTRHGKQVAAVVSIEDLRLLEALEAERDTNAAKRALAQHRATKRESIPWEDVKRDLGLAVIQSLETAAHEEARKPRRKAMAGIAK